VRPSLRSWGVTLLLATAFVAGCYSGPGADHLEAVLDELSIPEGWSLAKSETQGPDEEETCDPFESPGCPIAIRTYLTDGDATTAYANAKAMVAEAGFEIEDVATRECPGVTSSQPCYLFALRGDDDLHVAVFASAREAGLEDDLPGVVPVVIHVTSRDR
jgi:hypothetical protein